MNNFRKRIINMVHVSIFPIVFFCINLGVNAMDEMSELNTRLYNEYFNSTKGDASFLSTQKSNGRWGDINYSDTSQTNWEPVTHLDRILAMSKAYCSLVDKTSTNAVNLLAGIENGMVAWYDAGCRSTNWFFNDIGQQRRIGPILALMKNHLKQSTINKGCEYLIINGNPVFTNLVWEASGVLIKGAVLNNASIVKKALETIQSTITIRPKGKVGIQDDYSFLYHGLQLYNGGYGRYMLSDIIFWINITRGLSFGFSESDIELLQNAILEGEQWLIRRNRYGFGSVGRNLTRSNGTSAKGFKSNLQLMMGIDPSNSFHYQNMINHIDGKNDTTIIGNKMFYRADCMVQKRSSYHLSVKMCSNRTDGTESINGENIKGFWLPFGATCLMKDSEEYQTIMPLWDWTRVPGTTAAAETPAFNSEISQPTSFVGGVSNGTCGVAAMHLNKLNVTARKAWFMFDNETVCLGAGITSTNSNYVFTSLMQSILRGDVFINGSSKPKGLDVAYYGTKWVFHDNVGYFFPESTKILLTNKAKTGNWYSINQTESKTSFTESVFNLTVPHGLKPTDASYAYIINPDIKYELMQTYSDNTPIRILVNTSSVQAVKHDIQKITGIVFYKSGKLLIDSNLTVTVDQPCLVMVDQSKDVLQISVSDPTQSLSSVKVSLKYATDVEKVMNFSLPSGVKSGSSVTKVVETSMDEYKQYIKLDFAGTDNSAKVIPSVADDLFTEVSNLKAFNSIDGLTHNTDLTGIKCRTSNVSYHKDSTYMGFSFTTKVELPIKKIEGVWKRGNKTTAPTNVRIQIKGGGETPESLTTIYNANNTSTAVDIPFSNTLPVDYVIPAGSDCEVRVYIWYTNGYTDLGRTALSFYNFALSGSASLPSSIKSIKKTPYTAFFTGDKLTILGLDKDVKVNVFNLLGKKIFAGNSFELENFKIAEKGVFVIYVDGDIVKVIK